MIESPFQNEFHDIRVVVFMETKPMSDVFEQMIFSPDQRKRILDAIEKELPHKPDGTFIATIYEDHTYTFPNIKDDFTDEELKKISEEENENN